MSLLDSLAELETRAAARLDPDLADHIASGAGSEATLDRNLMAFDRLVFRPRILRDVSRIDCGGSVLGAECRLPVLLAPVGSLHRVCADANEAAVAAASAFGVPACISSIAQPEFDRVARHGAGTKILQLYIRDAPVAVDAILERAKRAGFHAVALTVDSARYGIRDRQRLGKYPSPASDGAGRDHQARLSWDTLDRIVQSAAPLPVILKGVQTAEDAEKAVAHGIGTLYISNHGGRQLDHARASLDALQEIRDALGPGPELILDGGIRRGTDVLKALALGATSVGLGRMTVWALALGGEAGVLRMLELLEEEITTALALLGVADIAELGLMHIAEATPIGLPRKPGLAR